MDQATREGIAAHMNDDHADACLLYAQKQAGIACAQSSVMVDVSLDGMDLSVDGKTVHVPFHREAHGRDDLRAVLVEMVKAARGA